jgi:hypothetical protein
MRWILSLLIGSMLLSACGDNDLPRLDTAHYVALSHHLVPVPEGVDKGEIVQLGAALVIDSTTTDDGDRWVLAEIDNDQSGRFRLYRAQGDLGLWLLTTEGVFFCANELACAMTDCRPTSARPTEAQLRELYSEHGELDGFSPVL